MCYLFLGVRCGFLLKRNTISLFVQAKKKLKNHTLTYKHVNNYLMYLYSIPETTLIIYGISIEWCVLYKCNADRWSCMCFRHGLYT
jgi:hypothetical protein